MPYTAITKPLQGEPTKKALADALIDNDAFFYSRLSVLSGLGISNGSFELDSNVDGIPDEWSRTLYTGGSFSITGQGLSDNDCIHGRRAVKFTSPGGGGNGGGYLDMADYIEVTPNLPVMFHAQLRASVAGIKIAIEIRFFDAGQNFVSSAQVYASTANPLVWTLHGGAAWPPANARYMKVRLIGAENTSTVAGSAYFDDVRLGQPALRRRLEFDAAGNHRWTCPAGVLMAIVECWGGGGGGGGATGLANAGGGGGGGGAYARKMLVTTPGAVHTVVVGAGGAGQSNNNAGFPGGTSTFGGTVSAGGGAGGAGSQVGTGGAGGTASGGDENINGSAGSNNPGGGIGADGGGNPSFGAGAAGGAAASDGNDGAAPAAGGGGAGNNTAKVGGDGHHGVVTIQW